MIPSPNVIDMYNGDGRAAVPDMVSLRQNGIFAIVHRVSQGLMLDPLYTARKQAALDAGLLFGGYHQLTALNATTQAARFLDLAEADANSFLTVVFEKSSSTPTLHQCMEFMQSVDDDTSGNVMCAMYSGTLIRQTLKPNVGGFQSNAMAGCEMFFAQHRLWLAEMGPTKNVPWPWSDKDLSLIWSNPFLWRFTPPGRINPVVGTRDLSYYPGDFDTLRANWPNLVSATVNPAI